MQLSCIFHVKMFVLMEIGRESRRAKVQRKKQTLVLQPGA